MTDKEKIEELEDEIQGLKEKIEDKEEELEDRNFDISRLEDEISDLEDKLKIVFNISLLDEQIREHRATGLPVYIGTHHYSDIYITSKK